MRTAADCSADVDDRLEKGFAIVVVNRHNHCVTKAFLLGAGLGTRLQPLTHRLPKPLVPLVNQPLIHYAWQSCRDVGCTDFAVNTHHLPQMWKDPWWGWNCEDWQKLAETGENGESVEFGHWRDSTIRLFHEPILLETGGGLRNLRNWMGQEEVLVHNGDIFSTMPLQKLVEVHQASGLPVTLALRSQGDARHIAWQDGKVTDIRNRLGRAEGTHVFSGIYCMNSELLEFLPDENIASVIPAFLRLAKDQRLGCVVIDEGDWWDLGERESYLNAHQHLMRGNVIHPTAQIADRANIERSCIGANAVIAAGAVIHDSVIWRDSHIQEETRLERCIVCSGQDVAGNHRNADL
jgi:NDP-sugar pyrophosphorylase family protein